jgi:hypothetical protein
MSVPGLCVMRPIEMFKLTWRPLWHGLRLKRLSVLHSFSDVSCRLSCKIQSQLSGLRARRSLVLWSSRESSGYQRCLWKIAEVETKRKGTGRFFNKGEQ